jgi:hypothetical protein
MHATSFNEVVVLVEKLSSEEKLRLIERVARDLQQQPQATPRLSWKDAQGLGKEIWEGVDVDQYIDALRDEWDR